MSEHPTIAALTAKRQAAEAEKARLREQREAIEAALLVAEMRAQEVATELRAAETWLALPKAARKRIYALPPETVAAFCATTQATYGACPDEWLALKLKKAREEHVFMRRHIHYKDTPEGTGVKILGSRGRAWCEALDAGKVADG